MSTTPKGAATTTSPAATNLQDSIVTVISSVDGKHYKMKMQGDIGMLTVQKIKRYLREATGLEPREQRLTYEQRLLMDHEKGSDFGLHDGAVIVLGALPLRLSSSSGTPQEGGGRSPNDSTNVVRRTTTMTNASPSRNTTVADAARMQLDVDWQLKEIQRVREEERQRYEQERRRRDEEDLEKELDRARVHERNKLLEQDFRDTERKLKIEVDKLRIQLSREEEKSRELQQKINRLEEDRVCELEGMKEERRRFENELQRRAKERQVADEEMEQLVMRQHREIDALRSENIDLGKKLREILHTTSSPPPPPVQLPVKLTTKETLEANLFQLSLDLGVAPLVLDSNQTCIVSLPDGTTNLILTFDPNTERLFLYTTLLNYLPEDLSTRHRLYEELLQGALLGRDMAGGSVGISKASSRLILLSISLDLRHVDEGALRAIAKPFIAATQKWTENVRRIVAAPSPQLNGRAASVE